jgi:hypothetical protein
VGGGKAAPPLCLSLNRLDKYLQVTSYSMQDVHSLLTVYSVM